MQEMPMGAGMRASKVTLARLYGLKDQGECDAII
jgi:hypothetical protein